jgi:hypothetical protein
MAHRLDLKLPRTAPAAYLSQTSDTGYLPIAIYTLVPLPEEELDEVTRVCQQDYDDDAEEAVRAAPEPHFISQPLRAVYDSHLQLGLQGEFDPTFFIVVTARDWKKEGLLLVTLINDDEPPAIESFMCEAESVSTSLLNLLVANLGFTDLRESFEVGVGYNNGQEVAEDDDNEKEGSPTDANGAERWKAQHIR